MRKILFLLILNAACTADETDICGDPSGSYSAYIHWEPDDDCPAENGIITFSVQPGEILWDATIPAWGLTGIAKPSQTPNVCVVQFGFTGNINGVNTLAPRFLRSRFSFTSFWH